MPIGHVETFADRSGATDGHICSVQGAWSWRGFFYTFLAMWALSLHQPQHARCNSSTSLLSVTNAEKLGSHQSPTPCWTCKFHNISCVFHSSLQHQYYTNVPLTPGKGSSLSEACWNLSLPHRDCSIIQVCLTHEQSWVLWYILQVLVRMPKLENYLNSILNSIWGQLGQCNKVLSQNKQGQQNPSAVLSAISKSLSCIYK